MLKRLKELSLKTKLTLYICRRTNGKMHTIHEGNAFEGDIPEWMNDFVNDSSPMLAFEQQGTKKIYFKWPLNGENTVVFLDDDTFSGLTLILNNLLAQPAPKADEASAAEIKILTEKLQQTRLSFEKEQKKSTAAAAEIYELKRSNAALEAQAVDQASRLKEAISENFTLQRKARDNNVKQESVAQVSEARSAITRLKDENSRLTAQIKGWEEKYYKLEKRVSDNAKKGTSASPQSGESEGDNASKGIVQVINALNKVIVTRDASDLNLDTLAMFMRVPSRTELESSPEAVKGVIATLLGMEKSGKLSPLQMKRLNKTILKSQDK